MCTLLGVGLATIVAGGFIGAPAIGQMGLALIGLGIAMMIMRDNQRTRRMLRRPGEHLGPLRSAPDPKDWV